MAIINTLNSILASIATVPMTLESGFSWNYQQSNFIMEHYPKFYVRRFDFDSLELVDIKTGNWILRTSFVEKYGMDGKAYVFVTHSGHKYKFVPAEDACKSHDTVAPNTYKKVVYRYTSDYTNVPSWFHGKYEKNINHGRYGDSYYYTLHLIGTYYVPINEWDKEKEEWAKERDLVRIGTVSFDSDFVDSLRPYKTKILRSNEFAFEYRKEVRKEAHERLNPNKDKEKADFIRWALTSD